MNADSQILYNYAVTTRRKQLSYYFSIKGKHVNSEQISNLYIVFTITFMNKYAHSQLKKIHYFSAIKKKKNISLFLKIYKTITGADHFYCKEIVHFTRKFTEELLKYQSLPVHSAVSYQIVNYFTG